MKRVFQTSFKLIILDEADAMTNDAQNALRRSNTIFCIYFNNTNSCFSFVVIEKYTENARFCLICNYLSKIIPALQSRCTRFRFAPLSPTQILPRLEYIIDKENVNVTEDGKQALIELAQGDMRKVINLLQSASMAFDVVNENNVYLCCGHPLKKDIENVLQKLLSSDFSKIFQGN